MANVMQYAAVFQSELDAAMVDTATSGWMEANAAMLKYEGGKEVKIPKMSMDGLADYDADGQGFVDGAVSLEWETKTMTQQRGRRFTLSEADVNDTNFVTTAARVMGEFQRTKVVPEVDAYRYSTIAAAAIAAENVEYGYTPDEATILKKLYADIAAVLDKAGSSADLVITMSTKAASLLSMSSQLARAVPVTEFQQGNVSLKVKSIDGLYPIIPVGSGLLKTKYQMYDGTTGGQTAGGFVPADDAKNINWIICPRTAPIAVSRTDHMRIFSPDVYQPKRAWAMDYLKHHDLWVPDNKVPGLRISVQQAKA